ncbi:MAG: 30S ribosomal protein S8 [Candidatus Peregrinibacteria bacterium]
MVTDPIADLITRMRNACMARRETVVASYSKINLAILGVLKKHKYIADFREVKTGSFPEIEITLDPHRKSLNLKRISKSGQRIYIQKSQIKPVCNHYGIALISTPKGVMTGEEAKKAGMGGEYLCEVW